ncbi:trypsin-like peptidase domain-containing protein [Amycolatopsis mongoliensis]|uniref:Trypsin-like peptidase domain-containing protein n=1 Tax=Amycolatopsis mongoliensis TaxID=715475 RepID=A0A9Y2JN03_9PSEU|nr:trypsin-like peptidase domain-containing protein [Amycolatopsis sp. 4-36]WIY00367.1 trypsin-like peptidase domain-containing protein [Amycolatopsis sp. 4-36]
MILTAVVFGAAGGTIAQIVASHFTGAAGTTVTVEPAQRLTGTSLDVATIAAQVEPSVVNLAVTTSLGRAAGTGIILTSDGSVVTNAHVVIGATSVSVTRAGSTTDLPAVVIAADRGADIALLRINGAGGLPAARLADSDSAKVGDDVVAIGNALDLGAVPSVTRGVISGLDRSLPGTETDLAGLLQTDAAISSGNSGGPLLNAAGQVIGVVTAAVTSNHATTAEAVNFAIPINDALQVLKGFGVTVQGG